MAINEQVKIITQDKDLVLEKVNHIHRSTPFSVTEIYDAVDAVGLDLVDEFLAIVRRNAVSVETMIEHIDRMIIVWDLPHNWHELPEKLTYLRSIEGSLIKESL